jgi:D-tyrosyl-tRNA(Tyr) deacylase
MRAVIQRVSEASVAVDGRERGRIGPGLMVLLGAGDGDTDADAEFVARKIAELRIFEDGAGKMNRSVEDVGGAVLVVSQFTLYGDCRTGRRPSFTRALAPGPAARLVDEVCGRLRARGLRVESGEFGAAMDVTLVNHGPVTLQPGRPVRLTFLGSGDAFGSGGRLQTCLLVDVDGHRLLVDCGATSLVALRRQRVDPATVEAVLITHLHGDHFGGLPFLLLDGQFRRGERPLAVAGPPGIEARLRDAMEALFPGSSAVRRRFRTTFLEWQAGRAVEIAGVRVTAHPVVHPSGAPPFALRLEAGGRVLAYSGDTEWTDTLCDAARGADVFVCEAYTYDRPIKYHLDYATLSGHRARLDCRRLVLTHMSDDMLGRLDGVPVEAAHDGLALDV